MRTPALNPALARQRAVILTSLIAVTVLAWLTVVRQTGAGMPMPTRGLGLTMGMGAAGFLGMWAVMMVGMMFPASAPMILTFSTIQARRRSTGRAYVPVAVFVASYISLWVAFGVVALGLAAGLDAVAERSDWLVSNWHRIAGGLLMTAGAYQFMPVKHTCLQQCRSPAGFLLDQWRDGWSGAFVMGLRHGLSCAACCWLLFVILIPLGLMNLVAMGVVTALVFAEKTFPRGEWIARAAGAAFLAYGSIVVVFPGALPGGM